MLSQTLLLSIIPLVLSAKIHVDVGKSGLTFNPSSITAAVGDEVQFEFYPSGHSVAQSSFDKPCQGSSGGFYSGFPVQPNGFTINITDTNPIYFFCSQIGHCNAGMVGAINAPTSGNTLDAYRSAAAGASLVAPTTVGGGVVGPLDESSDSSSSSESGVSSTQSSASSAASATGSGAASATGSLTPSASAATTSAATLSGSSGPSATNAVTSAASSSSSGTRSTSSLPTATPNSAAMEVNRDLKMMFAVIGLGAGLAMLLV